MHMHTEKKYSYFFTMVQLWFFYGINHGYIYHHCECAALILPHLQEYAFSLGQPFFFFFFWSTLIAEIRVRNTTLFLILLAQDPCLYT